MPGRPPKLAHVREAFLRDSVQARDLILAVRDLSAIKRKNNEPKLHPEQARRVFELAFLGMIASWEEFLEQAFVRYLAGAQSDNGYSPKLRVGKSSGIAHSYHLISGDPSFDPSRNYSRFSDPKWVIAVSKNYFELGAPFAPQLQANLDILQHAIKLRNRVAHNSTKSRKEFKQAALQHLGRPAGGSLPQGYGVGDLLLSKADRIFGQEARDKKWVFFVAYAIRLRRMARHICP